MDKRSQRWLWAIGVVTALIWAQSLLSAEQSGAESGAVSALLRAILGEGALATWIVTNLRKIAHFTEFAILGVTWGGFAEERRGGVWPLLPGLVTAVVDEILQMVSPGRAPMMTDALLDWAGFAAGWLVFLAVMWVWRRLQHKNDKNT